MSAKEPELISPEEIEAEGGPSVRRQAQLRMKPGWLPYIMIGGQKRGQVRYYRADWRAYLKARTRSHTRDAGAQAAA